MKDREIDSNNIIEQLEFEMSEEMSNFHDNDDTSSNATHSLLYEKVINSQKETNLNINPKKIIIIASICSFFMTVNSIAYLPILPAIQEEFKCTDLEISLSIVSYSLVMGFTPIIHGQLSDHYGRKSVLVPNLLAYIGSILIAGSSLNIWMLIISRGLLALFSSGFTTFCTSMIADVVPPNKRATAVGFSMIFAALGNIFCGPVAGFMSDVLGWRSTIYILIVFVIPTFIYIVFFIPETHHVDQTQTKLRLNLIRPFKLILTDSKIAFAAIPNSFTFASCIVASSLSSLLIPKYYDFSAFVIGLLLMNLSIGNFVGSIFGGKIADIIRSKRGRGGSLLLAAVSSIIVGIGLISIGALIPITAASFLIFLVSGFFMITTRGIVFSYSTEDNRKETGAIVSGLVCIQFINISVEMVVFTLLLNYIPPFILFFFLSLPIFITLLPSFILIKREWSFGEKVVVV